MAKLTELVIKEPDTSFVNFCFPISVRCKWPTGRRGIWACELYANAICQGIASTLY
uniref:Uncharacterized protein n=1 Tax=Manihot esculenta TaxID=3983 RepID=A0A2C9W206_MANES